MQRFSHSRKMSENLKDVLKNNIKPLLWGSISIAGMATLYTLLLIITTGDLSHPWDFFLDKWMLLTPLFLSFGIQIFLLQKIKMCHQTVTNKDSLNIVPTSASIGTNTVSMISCCAHHIADIVPVLGAFGIAGVLTEYQDWFLIFGILVNIGGIFYFFKKYYEKKKNIAFS